MENNSILFQHGEGSRISNAILKELKSDVFFKVVKHKKEFNNDEPVYSSKITFKTEKENDLLFLRNEITAMLTELFPINYFFRFTDAFSSTPYNYKLEFVISCLKSGNRVCCYTQIKEQKKDSKKITAYKIIVD